MQTLTGVKILDFTTLLPGPVATLMLADMGAEVLKISSPSRHDLVLDSEPFIGDTGISANQAWLHRNKRSLALNLKDSNALKIVKELLSEYDVIIEQFRPGVMDKMGLGYEELKKINPKLIYCSLTGYGQTGPLKDKAGHDINYLALSGLMSHSGQRSTGPVLNGTQIADIGSGTLHAVIGILGAIYFREKSGKGQYVDVAMLDGLLPFNSLMGAGFLAGGEMPERESGLLNGGSLYDFYETKDGRYLAVGPLEPKFWTGFCELIDRPDWQNLGPWPDNTVELKTEIKKIIAARSLSEWQEKLQGRDICVEPVINMQELMDSDYAKSREMIVDVPVGSENVVKQFGFPIKFSESPVIYKHAGYEIGQDNQAVLQALGYTAEQIAELDKQGTFA